MRLAKRDFVSTELLLFELVDSFGMVKALNWMGVVKEHAERLGTKGTYLYHNIKEGNEIKLKDLENSKEKEVLQLSEKIKMGNKRNIAFFDYYYMIDNRKYNITHWVLRIMLEKEYISFGIDSGFGIVTPKGHERWKNLKHPKWKWIKENWLGIIATSSVLFIFLTFIVEIIALLKEQ